MKVSYPFFLLLLFTLFIAGRPFAGNRISVTIDNLRNNKGQVLISLFKDGKGYPDEPEKAVRKDKATFTGGHKAVIHFTDLPAGKYAAVLLHDENSNLKMDKTWVGLPKEGYGFSNNVMGTFGPPGFSKASFAHGDDTETTITIRMRY